MKVSVFYVTFNRDQEFTRYSLRSYRKYATGFHEVVIAVPFEDVALFEGIAAEVGVPAVVKGYADTPGKGMLQHQVEILNADAYCAGDFILHMDGDTLFWETCSPKDFFVDGKPVLYRERFEDFRHYAARYSWKECVKNAIGIDPEWETMVRHPSVHPRWLYKLCRQAISDHARTDWSKYIISCRNEFPQTFAEFPTLGACAISQASDSYSFVDYIRQPEDGDSYKYKLGRDKVVQFWSHGGVGKVQEELDGIVR